MRIPFMQLMYVFLFCHAVYAQEGQATAMVIQINGDAFVVGSSKLKLKTGSILSPNDSVDMNRMSTLLILDSDGKIKEYNRSFKLSQASAPNPIINKLILQGSRNQSWFKSAKSSVRNNLRSDTEAEITMVYPRNTRLRQAPDQLTWTTSSQSDSDFEVSLRCYENDFSYDEITKNNSLRLPSGIAIPSSRQYYWFVRNMHTELSEIPPAVWFNVLDQKENQKLQKEKQTIAEIMQNDTLSVAFQLLYVNLLMSYELYYDCKMILDKIVKLDPSNSIIYTFYAAIYDKTDMLSESRKYIEYADRYGH